MQLRKMEFHRTNKVKVKKLYRITNPTIECAADMFLDLPNVAQNLVSRNMERFFDYGCHVNTRVKSSLKFKVKNVTYHIVKTLVGVTSYAIIKEDYLKEDNDTTMRSIKRV